MICCCFRGVTAAVVIAGPRLDLDEDHRVFDARDDVDFAVSGAILALKNRVPTTHQLLTREVLPCFSKGLTTIRRQGLRLLLDLSCRQLFFLPACAAWVVLEQHAALGQLVTNTI
jgi:hypothetical protein